jgi:hypothetical protein|tara:strand:- start:12 stop:278 length:267 start_codon:yes stop_codon:yes gene_type:complete
MIAGLKVTISMAFATLLKQLFGPGRTLFLLSRGIAPVTMLAGDLGRRLAGSQQGTVFGEEAISCGAGKRQRSSCEPLWGYSNYLLRRT